MSGSAIRAVPGPFSPLCGIRPPIAFPHNEPIGDPGGSRPFPPLCATLLPLGLAHNERLGDPGGSGAVSPHCRPSMDLVHNGRSGNPGGSSPFPPLRPGAAGTLAPQNANRSPPSHLHHLVHKAIEMTEAAAKPHRVSTYAFSRRLAPWFLVSCARHRSSRPLQRSK